ncbi:kelch-like protein [Corallococcus sp. AB038B]|uniref:RCC1 domain-containing protein n=1 Tax=Corallococcus sp. AB038B TaxID=2316718 RepID=UPI00131523BE|nr:kelch-like protein [Corallococcus sp. AB038B]
MKSEKRRRLALLAIGVVLALSGCSTAPAVQEGSAQAVVSLPQTLSAGDITRVDLITSGPGMTTRIDALVKTGGQWGGVLGNLPAGNSRTFSAMAFDNSNTLLYLGQATDVAVVAGQTTAITLMLQEANPPLPAEDTAPRILSLVASAGTVAHGGQIELQAVADSTNPGDTLTYEWGADAGTFSDPFSLTTSWTAPAYSGPVELRLWVVNSKGTLSGISVTVMVAPENGSAAVNISVNHWPIVDGIAAIPTAIAVGQPIEFFTWPYDSDGDILSIEWSSNCAGSWTHATTSRPSFTPSAPLTSSTCTFVIDVRDGRGGQGIRKLTIHTGTPTTGYIRPSFLDAFQSRTTVPPIDGTVVFRVRANDPQGSPLSFTWAANSGTLHAATSTTNTSEVIWTADDCLPDGIPPTVTVTALNALGLSATQSFTLQAGIACSTASVQNLQGGYNHSLALMSDGIVWAWGGNYYSQLGDGAEEDRPYPAQVPGMTNAVAIAAGERHNAVLKNDGTVWTWGPNYYGQQGNGGTGNTTAQPVQGLTNIIAIASQRDHTAALKDDGTVWLWGDNGFGQLGDEPSASRYTPMMVPGLTGVRSITVGGYFSFAQKTDGTVFAWGYNLDGQLCSYMIGQYSAVPVRVWALTASTAISAGTLHTLALMPDRTVIACGSNSSGQLGIGTTTDSHDAVRIPGLTDVVAIAAGTAHSLAVKSDGTVWAWGYNDRGQLGDGTTTNRLTPVQVQGLTGVVGVAAGNDHSIARKSDGTIWAWGTNYSGQLGTGAAGSWKTIPVQTRGAIGFNN